MKKLFDCRRDDLCMTTNKIQELRSLRSLVTKECEAAEQHVLQRQGNIHHQY